MMKRQWFYSFLVGAGLLASTAASASAQVVQVHNGGSRSSIGFTLGGFVPRSEDGRDIDDTLLADLDDLDFRIKDFKSFSFGAEYLFAVNDFIEAGAGVSYSQKQVPTVYADFVNTNGNEITQDLKLRIVPITATIRFLPLGRRAPIQPYVGGGVGFYKFRYSEIGEFVDFTDNSVFSNRSNPYIAEGTAVGPVLLGGIRFPLGDVVTAGGEVRWQKATGDTGGIDQGFLGDKIDLGGVTANFTIHFRF